MDELELLKKHWNKSSTNYPSLNKADLYKLINMRSSSIVKWIFIISLLEFLGWSLISFLFDGTESLEKMNNYNVEHIFLPFDYFWILSFICILLFILQKLQKYFCNRQHKDLDAANIKNTENR